MYYQIKPTEKFRERELALLMEAEKRPLVGWRVGARRTPTKARSTIALAVVGFLGALAVASLMLASSSSPAHAASTTTTFLVNSTDDQPDADTTDGKCVALNGSCTLRAAIQQANATPGADVIEFAISGGEVHTITPSPQLPVITEAVTIDGYSQPGSQQNTLAKGTNAKILIELRNADPLGGFGLVVNAPNVVIKGLNINNFASSGIFVGAEFSGSAEGVKIQGNFIGTDPTGITGLGNDGFGVLVGARSGVTIGGTSSATRNLISGNNLGGVSMSDSSNIKVLGNLIGTKRDGKGALGNGGDGVEMVDTTNTLVGGATAASANIIAFNKEDGVELSVGTSTTNRVLRNSVFRNDGLGIDLLGSGEEQSTNVSTPNDSLDADEGPNGLQNKPVLPSAKTISGKTTIKGRLSSKKNQTYVVRFFSNPKGNEGKTFIGQKKVTTGKDGKVSFTFSPAQKVGVGKLVTATATGSEGTSEFSAPRKVAAS